MYLSIDLFAVQQGLRMGMVIFSVAGQNVGSNSVIVRCACEVRCLCIDLCAVQQGLRIGMAVCSVSGRNFGSISAIFLLLPNLSRVSDNIGIDSF